MFVGHGTSVGGVIAAQSDNGKGGVGIAPDTKLIPIKVLNTYGVPATGISQFFPIMEQAIHYVIGLGAKVINMSWLFLNAYLSVAEAQRYQALIDAAHAAGVLIVAAAGNDYKSVDSYFPASFNNVIAVSATDQLDQRASDEYGAWSNSGNAIDFSAPGVDILSPVLLSKAYMNRGGTSLSAPLVSGLAAMIFSQDPTATPDDVYRRLKYSSVDLGTSGWDPYFGWGRINAFQALSYDYYENGAIKTQWLESPNENGWNKLSFDIHGYLTGGTYVNVPSFAGSGTKSFNAVAPASKPVITSSISSSPEVFGTQFSKDKGIGPWHGWAGASSEKTKKKEDDGISKSGPFFSADKKKGSEAPKTKVKEKKKNISQTPQPFRAPLADQKTIQDSFNSGTILRSVLGSPLAGSAVSLFGAGPASRQTPPRR